MKRLPFGVLAVTACTALIVASLGLGGYAVRPAQAEDLPYMRAFPDWDSMDGSLWPAGQTVTLTINGADTFTAVAGGDGYVAFELSPFNLQQGDALVMASGAFTVAHTVEQLFITAIDPVAQTVAGTVGGQKTVHVWSGSAELYLTSNPDGAWLADFSAAGGVLAPGACVNAEAWGEGANSTIIGTCLPPNPWLIAFPENDAVEGWEWPDGATVRLTIDGVPGFEREATAAVTTWGDPRTYFRIDFAGMYDLKVGDVVRLTSGELQAAHTVQPLAVTGVNSAADWVAGTASPGAQVQVWPHGSDAVGVSLAVNPSGQWQARFGERFDLAAGTGGRAWIVGEGGNATAVDWNVLEPPPPAQPTVQVRVPAEVGWLDSGVTVSPDVPIAITAQGQAQTASGQDFPGAVSGPEGQVVACSDFDGVSPCALDGAPYGALIGKIGADGEPFFIGAGTVLYPGAEGNLWLSVNDNLPWYADNQGGYTVFLGQ